MDKIYEEHCDQVLEQKVNGVTMENAIADLIDRLERSEVETERVELQLKAYKQLNNRHKNIIDTQRVMLKWKQFERDGMQLMA